MAKYEPLEISAEQLEKLDEEFDGILHLRGPAIAPWRVVLRRPTSEEVHAFKALCKDKQKEAHANLKLVSALSVYPKKDTKEWSAQYARWPMAIEGIANSEIFSEFCGIAVHVAEREKE